MFAIHDVVMSVLYIYETLKTQYRQQFSPLTRPLSAPHRLPLPSGKAERGPRTGRRLYRAHLLVVDESVLEGFARDPELDGYEDALESSVCVKDLDLASRHCW